MGISAKIRLTVPRTSGIRDLFKIVRVLNDITVVLIIGNRHRIKLTVGNVHHSPLLGTW